MNTRLLHLCKRLSPGSHSLSLGILSCRSTHFPISFQSPVIITTLKTPSPPSPPAFHDLIDQVAEIAFCLSQSSISPSFSLHIPTIIHLNIPSIDDTSSSRSPLRLTSQRHPVPDRVPSHPSISLTLTHTTTPLAPLVPLATKRPLTGSVLALLKINSNTIKVRAVYGPPLRRYWLPFRALPLNSTASTTQNRLG